MKEIYECPTCHHQSNVYWVGLTTGLIDTLVKFKRTVITKGINSLHLEKDCELSYSQHANFSKLRVHGLVAKDDKAGSGYWLLTHRGSEFLKGNIQIPRKVKVINNVVHHDENETVEYVSVEQIYGSAPYFDDIQTVERERLPLELAQTGLPL